MATKKLTFNNVEYDIDMDKLSSAIAAFTERVDKVKKVIIILEGQRDNASSWYYNGEVADGNFVYDCLTSGATIILKAENYSYELVEWTVEDGKLNLYTNDGSVRSSLTISV